MRSPGRASCSWPGSRTERRLSTTDRTWTDGRRQMRRRSPVGIMGRRVEFGSPRGARKEEKRVSEENKAVVRRYFEEFHDNHEHGILEEIMVPDLLEPTRLTTHMMLTAFPDYRLTIEEQIAEEEKVATVWTGSGTHQGEWESPAGSVAPTGREVRWMGTSTLRLSEGKISDVIASSWDHLGILQQLGAVDVTEPRTGA